MSTSIAKIPIILNKLTFLSNPNGGVQIKAISDPSSNTIWMTVREISRLFERDEWSMDQLIKRIIQDGLLIDEAVTCIMQVTASDGKVYKTRHFNFDVVIAVGYRVTGDKAALFQKWANETLRSVAVNGYSIDADAIMADSKRFMSYVHATKDIRTKDSHTVRMITDIIATSTDYVKNSLVSKDIIMAIHRMLHVAVHGHTAMELLYARADHTKPLMGMLSYLGERPAKRDVLVAKNYMTFEEITKMDRLTSRILSMLEDIQVKSTEMVMHDWVCRIHAILDLTNEDTSCRYSKVKWVTVMNHLSMQLAMYIDRLKDEPVCVYPRMSKQFIIDIRKSRITLHDLLKQVVDPTEFTSEEMISCLDIMISIMIDSIDGSSQDSATAATAAILSNEYIQQFKSFSPLYDSGCNAIGIAALSVILDAMLQLDPANEIKHYTASTLEILYDACTVAIYYD
jgi:hypothetical protein